MIRGQRFELNLDDDEDDTQKKPTTSSPLPGAFVADVLERVTPASAAAPPKLPTAPSLSARSKRTGFPEHGGSGASRFRQRREGATAASKTTQKEQPPLAAPQAPDTAAAPPTSSTSSSLPAFSNTAAWAAEERTRIDRENAETLARMTPEQIEAERRELMESISPAFLQKLLARADVSSGSAEVDLVGRGEEEERRKERKEERRRELGEGRRVMFAEGAGEKDGKEEEGEWEEGKIVETREEARAFKTAAAAPADSTTEDITTAAPPAAAAAANDDDAEHPLAGGDSIHFPQPNQPPSLDPSSPSFLTDLHSKYFPYLPSDPSKLAWMVSDPVSASTSSYSPHSPALAASALRFDFRGALIPPSRAAAIPVTAGLHHHGDAPDAAGYTVAELAHLARSTVPAQRCVAFQTLGRFLFRLGRGEFGNPAAEQFEDEEDVVVEEDVDEEAWEGKREGKGEKEVSSADLSELAQGLWREVDRCRVIPMLVDEAEGRGVDGGRHLSAKAYATEAVWLWRKGGGRRWKAA